MVYVDLNRSSPTAHLCHNDEMTTGSGTQADARLAYWLFESDLKKRYLTFLSAVEALSHDNMVSSHELFRIFEYNVSR